MNKQDLPFDVAVIGAGAVGSAIARELSRYQLSVALIEANPDVGMGTSKASTAIWHTGYDAEPGSLEAALLRRSYPLMEAFMQEVGSPFERVGGLLVAWTREQLETLPALVEKAHKNRFGDVHPLSREEVYAREPRLGNGALGGMFVPGEGILCTFTIPLACATQAVVNGATLKLDFPVKSIQEADGIYMISSHLAGEGETIRARWVINAAGLFSDEIDAHFGHGNFSVRPRRGELIVYDKLARSLVNHIVLPVPTPITKGVLISPTVYGNVLLGPTAEDLPDKTATNTSAAGLQMLLEKGRMVLPALLEEEVTATYAGLRAATEHTDYQISLHADQRYICVGGIRSTGISGSLGIAEYVRELLEEAGVTLEPRPEFKSIRMPNIGEAFLRPYQSAELIMKNPDYGRIVCHCERVTLGELLDARSAAIPAKDLDALRRRTRAMQGRCPGFNCQASLMNLILSERHSESTALSLAQVSERRISDKIKETVQLPRALPQSEKLQADVLIVGAGPAGLSAALELKRLGVDNVVIAEREAEAGGIPRMCGHTGFGLNDLHRVLTGPSYAQKYREMIGKAGIEVFTSTTVTGWDDNHQLSFTSPAGIGSIAAKAILLATGVRERPRAARLVPGARPEGVYTTGSLQRFVYEHHLPVGERAVIAGAEIVSLSAALTLRHASVRVLCMLTELPHHQLYLPVFLPAKVLYTDILNHIPILANSRITNILGRGRVQAIEVTDLSSGKKRVLDCDTIVFTGDWISEHELARKGKVETGHPTLGPRVDAWFRTSQHGIFAAGNLLRGVERADWAALEGRRAARSIARFLVDQEWPEDRLEVLVEPPLAWISPNILVRDPGASVDGFRFRSHRFCDNVILEVKQGASVLYQKSFRRLNANTSLNLSSDWVKKVDFTKGPVRLIVQS
ncbi:MAG TPA: FAD-dependent oxidoreductase [Anaerolineales bacterium]|nr:FAD-dependent oxidoreductase [Anaerolineales bacterium]